MSKETEFTNLNIRIGAELKRKFVVKASRVGGTSVVVRELLQAFVENRVTLTPPTLEGTIYHVK